MAKIINGVSIPNIPWEDRPEGCKDVVWRCSKNPIIDNSAVYYADRIYNSAAVPFNGGFAGVFRVDSKDKWPNLRVGFSKNGIDWDISDTDIEFKTEPDDGVTRSAAYDPRICFIEDRYYLTWASETTAGSSIGLAYTFDFKEFHRLEYAFLPTNRNGVLFPRKINGEYYMLSRPCDRGNCLNGNIWVSRSSDLTYWGKHRFIMRPTKGWQAGKLGPGPVPIETDEGWLMIYHGTQITCNGYIYSFGAALLDIDDPSKVLYRTKPFLLAPNELYERVGDVPNVVFPCAALCDKDTGKIAIYYGAADTVTGLAFTQLDELISFIKENSM